MTNHPMFFGIKREHEARNETLSPGHVRSIHVCCSFLGMRGISNERRAIDMTNPTYAESERPEYTSNVR